MKVLTGLVAVLVMAASAVYGAEASLSLDVASAYVFRGATFNDGLVAQPGLEVGGLGGLSVGVWGNIDIDDMDGALEGGEFSEIDIYGSYALPVEVIDLSIGYTEYTYPLGGVADREVGVSAGTAAGSVDLGIDVFYGIDGGIEKTLYAELSAGTGFDIGAMTAEIGATVGFLDPDEGESGLHNFTATAGLGYGAIGASVTYIGQIDDDVLVDVEDGGSYDVEVVGVLSAAVDF